MSDYSIFKPKSKKGIFVDYPDLRKIQSFSGLKDYEMLFVWYYACESSPLYSIENEAIRVRKSLEHSYLVGNKISKDDTERMVSGDFTPKITAAVADMQKYRVGPRIRAKMVIEKGFENMETILNIDAGDSKMFLNKDNEVDFGKKKAYVDTLAKAVDLMPKLINQLEGGFHLTEEKGTDETSFEGESLMDQYHDQKD